MSDRFKSIVVVSAFSFLLGWFSGAHVGEKLGATEAYKAERLSREQHDVEMQKLGFCEWPKAFYRSINCGSLAPDYEDPK